MSGHHLFGSLLLQAGAMTSGQPVTMTAAETSGRVGIVVTANGGEGGTVTYSLSVSGASTIYHAGRTSISRRQQTLSQVTISAQRPWTATLQVQSDRGAYELRLAGGRSP